MIKLIHKFVKNVPEKIEDGIIYVSIEYSTAIHKCCCGCGNEVVTPFSPTDWKLTFDGETISLYPSIGNWDFKCQSHYWITNNEVEWAPRWSRNQVEHGREKDDFNKKEYFQKKNRNLFLVFLKEENGMTNKLTPTNIMTISLPSGNTVDLPVCHLNFSKWSGKLPNFDFGKKPIVNHKGKGVFAELAILGLLVDSGWNGVWVETYGGIHFLKEMPSNWKLSQHNISIPLDKETLLKNIWKTGKTTACFDVFAWKGNEILFCEGKHKGKDRLTKAQTKFIEGALACGVSAQSLMIVEWEMI